ncbi:MAG TPA: response regulator transcription factor [Candidatus Dormibacteraeota bacterium]
MAIRLIVAEDNLLVREGIRQLLSTVPDIDVIAVCADRDALLAAAAAEKPDAVVTDIRMPPTNTDEGIEVAARLREISPKTAVVVLSQYSDAEYALRLFAQGAAGRAYLLKERVYDLEQLAGAIRDVARGGSVVDPKIVEALIAARARKAQSPIESLTGREREVLAHVAQGKNNAAIATGLFLTERAVEKHINAIFSKLGLSEERDIHRRVKATLIFLSEESPQVGRR